MHVVSVFFGSFDVLCCEVTRIESNHKTKNLSRVLCVRSLSTYIPYSFICSFISNIFFFVVIATVCVVSKNKCANCLYLYYILIIRTINGTISMA